jgi:hypothetical protein
MALFGPFQHHHMNGHSIQRLQILSIVTVDSGISLTASKVLYFLSTWPQFPFLTKRQKCSQKPRQRPWLQPAHYTALVGASTWNPHHSILHILWYSLTIPFPMCQLSLFRFSHLRRPPFPSSTAHTLFSAQNFFVSTLAYTTFHSHSEWMYNNENQMPCLHVLFIPFMATVIVMAVIQIYLCRPVKWHCQ